MFSASPLSYKDRSSRTPWHYVPRDDDFALAKHVRQCMWEAHEKHRSYTLLKCYKLKLERSEYDNKLPTARERSERTENFQLRRSRLAHFHFSTVCTFQPSQGFYAGFPLVPRVVYQWSIITYLRDSLSAVIVRRLENGPSTQSPISTHAPPPSPHHQHATTLPFFKRAPQISQRRRGLCNAQAIKKPAEGPVFVEG